MPLCEAHFPDQTAKNPWAVQFYHSLVKKVHDSREAFEQLASSTDQLEGTKVGAVDCQHNTEFCAKQGIREAPTFRVLHNGNTLEFEGETSVDALLSFVKESLKRFADMEEALQCSVKGLFPDAKKDVAIPLCTTKLPPSTEALPWMVAFYETGDRNKDKTIRSVMNKLGEKYGNIPPKKDAKKKVTKLRVGAVDCNGPKQDCEALGIKSLPTVRFYQSGKEPMDFDSFFDKDEIKQWADARLKEMPKPQEANPLQTDVLQGASGASSASVEL